MFAQYNLKWQTINNMDLMKYEIICTSFELRVSYGCPYTLQMLMCAQKPFEWIKCASTMYGIHTLQHMLESHAIAVTSIDWWWIYSKTHRTQRSKMERRYNKGDDWMEQKKIVVFYFNEICNFSQFYARQIWNKTWKWGEFLFKL